MHLYDATRTVVMAIRGRVPQPASPAVLTLQAQPSEGEPQNRTRHARFEHIVSRLITDPCLRRRFLMDSAQAPRSSGAAGSTLPHDRALNEPSRRYEPVNIHKIPWIMQQILALAVARPAAAQAISPASCSAARTCGR